MRKVKSNTTEYETLRRTHLLSGQYEGVMFWKTHRNLDACCLSGERKQLLPWGISSVCQLLDTTLLVGSRRTVVGSENVD